MQELSTRFPPGFTYSIPYDTTRFVEVSIREVLKTLGAAIVLVILVVYLFLQNWRATIIPTVAVPVALTGTFAGLYLLDYSINTLTLFGMVLSIGIVVDDAIVVLENVERHMREEHLDARSAAIRAMREVTGPVIAIVLVLTSVFVPIAFLGGLTGELYRQFAVTISIAVVISGLIALTLTPALCVLILKLEHHQPGPNSLYRLRLHRRRLSQQGRYDLRHAKALGRTRGQGVAAGRRAVRQDRRHQGGAGAGVQSAGDFRSGNGGWVRVLHPEPRQ